MSPYTTPDLVRSLYAALGIELRRSWRTEALTRCFTNPDAHHHADNTPSTSVNLESGAWYCHGCGASGGAYDAAIARGHTPRDAMDLLIRHGLAEPRRFTTPRRATGRQATPLRSACPPRQVPLNVTERDVERWALRLSRDQTFLTALEDARGITSEVLVAHRIGLDGNRITIPVRDEAGQIMGLLRYQPFAGRRGPKMLAAPGSRRGLFPSPESTPAGKLHICEGEPDALAALSRGVTAIAIPGVAGWRREWAIRLQQFRVSVCMDCDAEGRAAAARIADDLTAAGITCKVVDLAPERSDGFDVTDALLAGTISPLTER